jgi:hypothetical protein
MSTDVPETVYRFTNFFSVKRFKLTVRTYCDRGQSWWRNVPADPLLQNLSDFTGRREKDTVPKPPPPSPTPSRSLPAVLQERPDGLVPVYSGTVPVSGAYEKLTVPSCE